MTLPIDPTVSSNPQKVPSKPRKPRRPLSPPMVNGHTHAAMTLFRGFADDMPLMEWLRTRIWPAEAKLEPEDVYWGTRLACIEMIRAGTTKFVDMYWYAAETAAAVRDSGMRAVISNVIIDQLDPAASGSTWE